MKSKFKKERCPWLNLKNQLYVDYHDQEWGRPAYHDHRLFEMITLEGAQAGLSWETVLNKRTHYRKVFASFNPLKVSKFSQAKIELLLLDAGIVRNRLKVESTISNAKAFLKIQKEFGSFNVYLWAFVNGTPLYNSFENMSDYPTSTKLSDEISKDLKKRGFRFVGSTIIYAFMQAVGITQDHSKDCYLHGKKFQSSE